MARTMHEPEAEESAAAAPKQCAGGAVQGRGQESGCCRQLGVEARARQACWHGFRRSWLRWGQVRMAQALLAMRSR